MLLMMMMPQASGRVSDVADECDYVRTLDDDDDDNDWATVVSFSAKDTRALLLDKNIVARHTEAIQCYS